MPPQDIFVAKTKVGNFKVKYDYNTIFVGGKKYCITLANKNTYGYLDRLETANGECELDGKQIKRDNTVHMTDLAFTIMKGINPSIQNVTFLDDSHITYIDNNEKKSVLLLSAYVLLYQKTYYEQKFNATMQYTDKYKEYVQLRTKGFNDPSMKPPTFDFMDTEVQDMLEPLYKATNTWYSFIELLKSTYKDTNIYKIIRPWYRHALHQIFQRVEISQFWQIDITNRPIIQYTRIEKKNTKYNLTRGGKRKSRRISFSAYKQQDIYSNHSLSIDDVE